MEEVKNTATQAKSRESIISAFDAVVSDVIAAKSAPKPKHAGGRPKQDLKTKIDFSRIGALVEAGLTNKQLAVALEVDETVIYAWKKANAEFSQVLKKGKVLSDDAVERSLWERANGYSYPAVKIFCNSQGLVTREEYTEFVPPDPTSMIFWLKNRRPAEWRDRREVTTTININNIDFTKLATDELAKIAANPNVILSTAN